MDVKYLPQMQDESSRRYLFVAIDRDTLWVFVQLKANKTAASAQAFLKALHKACPIRISKLLTDNGKEFTDRLFASKEREPSGNHEFDQLCQELLGIEHRLTRPRTPRTNGMVEGFNRRITDVLNSIFGSVLCMRWYCCIMNVMRNSSPANRSTAKEASHERIVEAAARAIRRSGYGGTGVADIMKEAGLTHGAFYAHFASREAMLAEAADRAGAEANAIAARVVAAVPPDQSLQALVAAYLSQNHLEGVETGCPTSALGSEMHRQSPEVRLAATRRIKEMVDLVARQLPDWGQPGAHERALVTVATMVGTLILARAVDDAALSGAFRSAALNSLVSSEV